MTEITYLPEREAKRKANMARIAKRGPAAGYLLLLPTVLFMIVAVGLPLVMLVLSSFWSQDYLTINRSFSLANYIKFFGNPLYVKLLLRSLGVSFAVTACTVILAYPMAYMIAFHAGKHRTTWLILITVPFWTSYLLRVFSWKVILGFNGVINSGLISLGVITDPIEALLYNPLAVILTLTHAWVPFVLLPIYVSLSKIDPGLREAAADLGDGALWRFLRVILPLSMPGVISGALLVFIPTVGDYVTPAMVGGPSGAMIGTIIQGAFGRGNNWPLGAAMSVVVMIVVTIAALLMQHCLTRLQRGAR